MAYRSFIHKRRFLIIVLFLGFFVGFTVLLFQAIGRERANEENLKKCQELVWLLQTKNLITGHVLYHKSQREEKQVHPVKAWHFQMKEKRILEHLLLAQNCPWEPDPVAVTQYRQELEKQCNASFYLILTKSNTPLGSYIITDVDGKKIRVSRELLDMLPEKSNFSFPKARRCAVVGNSGILRDSGCGKEIDQADLIFRWRLLHHHHQKGPLALPCGSGTELASIHGIYGSKLHAPARFNLPAMNFSEDVGTRTTLVTINPSVTEKRFKGLQERRKPFADTLRHYKDAFFFIPSFSFASVSDYGYRMLYTMEDFGLVHRAFFLNPKYLGSLAHYWKREGVDVPRLSSGFMFTSVALEFCQHVTLYGFWPFPHDLSNRPIPHHYYDDRWPPPNVHNMPREFSHFLELYAQGVLRIRLGRCQ